MEAYLCVTELLPGNNINEVANGHYIPPMQQQQQTDPVQQQQLTYLMQRDPRKKRNPPLEVFQNQNVQRVNPPANVSNMVGVLPVNNQFQVSSGGNPPTANDDNYYNQEHDTNVSNGLCDNTRSVANNYVGQVYVEEIMNRKAPGPQMEQLNVNSNRMNASGINFGQNYNQQSKSKPPECHMKRVAKIPEPTQVKINTDLREKIGNLKIQVSGSFLSWNVTGRTILDLNFMRNLFYITKMDVILQRGVSYQTGVQEGLKKMVENNLFSDWLVLKCEEKQMPFFKVNNQVEIYSVNNFTALLSIIAQESCLPLPFITRHEKSMKYFYLNFPKWSNNRVKKLNVPIFHDADNGRKKIPCKYPGIRLDCTFESAIQRFVIHVEKSAVPAFREYVSYLRQVIIYNHIVWGFLQAWTRKVKEQYNGCFKTQEIAQNLSLCQGETPEHGKTLSGKQELIYLIDYSNFYLKFDPVALKDTTVTFTIDNFETNFVSDIPIVQYYRQFFLINDMHYSDALKNIVLFSEENGARNVTEFVYKPPTNNADRSNAGFFPPGGISRSSSQRETPQIGKNPVQTNVSTGQGVQSTKQTAQGANSQIFNVTDARPSGAGNNGEQVSGRNPSTANAPPSKPLLKARTVEEINSSIEMKKNSSDGSKVSFDSMLTNQKDVNKTYGPPVPQCIRETLNHCYVRNRAEICNRDVSRDPRVLERVFRDAVSKAMEMRSVDAFVEKLYVTLQKYFTNATCQIMMNRTIRRALEMRFPNFMTKLSGQNRVACETSSTREPVAVPESQEVTNVSDGRNAVNVTPSQPKPPEKVRETKGNKPAPGKQVVSPHVKSKPPCQPEAKTIERPLQEKNPNPTPMNPSEQSPKRGPVMETFPISKTSPATPPKPSFNQETIPKINVIRSQKPEESSCNISNEIDHNQEASDLSKTPTKGKGNVENVTKPTKGTNCVTEASMTVVEGENNISISLTVPILEDAESRFVDETTPQKAEEEKQEQEHEQSTNFIDHASPAEKEMSPKERGEPLPQTKETSTVNAEGESELHRSGTKGQDLFARCNIKPCSVVLNANDIANYQKIQKNRQRLRKRSREAIYTPSALFGNDDDDDHSNTRSDDDSRDSDFVAPGTKPKKKMKISELQYMEARTRVLHRLRKRTQMYAISSQTVYTSEELDQFLVQTPRGSRSLESPCATDQPEEASGTEDSQYRTLYDECLTRKAKVVLVRLEDTPEHRKQRDKWRVVAKVDGRLTLTRDCDNEYGNLPRNKRKYFDVKDGKLYLKEQYQVKNGKIVPINLEMGGYIINLKGEPPAVQPESDFSPSFIKRERLLE